MRKNQPAVESLEEFFNSLSSDDNDIYQNITLEVLFEELFNESGVSVSSKKRQEGHQITRDDQI